MNQMNCDQKVSTQAPNRNRFAELLSKTEEYDVVIRKLTEELPLRDFASVAEEQRQIDALDTLHSTFREPNVEAFA